VQSSKWLVYSKQCCHKWFSPDIVKSIACRLNHLWRRRPTASALQAALMPVSQTQTSRLLIGTWTLDNMKVEWRPPHMKTTVMSSYLIFFHQDGILSEGHYLGELISSPYDNTSFLMRIPFLKRIFGLYSSSKSAHALRVASKTNADGTWVSNSMALLQVTFYMYAKSTWFLTWK